MSPPRDDEDRDNIVRLRPGNGNGNGAPYGAEPRALAELLAQSVASMRAAERSFNSTAQTLVDSGKTLQGELDETKGILLRVEGKLDTMAKVVGTWPEPISPEDVIRRMQTQSVQDMTMDQVVARENRVRAELEERAQGTGLCGLVARGAHLDQITMERVSELIRATTKETVSEVVAEEKAGRSSKVKTIAGYGTGVVAALTALVMALGGPEGLSRIIEAFKR